MTLIKYLLLRLVKIGGVSTDPNIDIPFISFNGFDNFMENRD